MPPLPENKKQQLQDLIDVMEACGAPKEILNARIKKITAGLDLPNDALAEVKKAFTKAGFTVLNVASGLSAITLLPPPSATNAFAMVRDSLHQYMRGDKGKLDPNSEIMQKVDDIFDFLAAYRDNDVSNARSYRNATNPRDQKDIHDKFGDIIAENSGPKANNHPYRFYLEMAQAAQKLLEGDCVVRYTRYLNLEKLKKKYPFLTKLAQIPDNIKLEPWFAKECIAKLQMCFTEDEAIAFYNFLGALKETPYEKESTSVSVVCSSCGTVHSFTSLKEAVGAKCKCGVPLYRQCPQCSRHWPSVISFCPECGMNMDAIHDFPIHYQNAEDALRASNPVRARAEYSAAKLCNPMEVQKLKDLDARITAMEGVLGKPLREIEGLIDRKQFNMAQSKINAVGRQYPGIDLRSYSSVVNAKLEWARRENGKIAALKLEKDIIEQCMRILAEVSDDPGAANKLSQYRPEPVLNPMVRENPNDRSCAISWSANPKNTGVTYTVVRKENSSAPSTISDGTVVAEDIRTLNVRDDGLKPGVNYYYSIFAVRGSSESEPASIKMPVLFLQEVKDFDTSSMKDRCVISWHSVPGSAGVRVLRDGKIIAPCVTTGSFVDDDADEGEEYTYVLQTVWRIGSLVRYSQGISKTVVLESMPDPIVISAAVNEGSFQISWKAPATNRTITLLSLKPGRKVASGTTFPVSQLAGMGDVLRDVPSFQGRYSQNLAPNAHMNIAAFVRFGDSVVACNTVSVSNVPGCRIDQARTCVQNNLLRLSLSSVPGGAAWVAYSIRSDRFATHDEAASLPCVAKDKWNTISGNSNGKDMYVSVFAVYESGGNRFYSAPDNCLLPAGGRAAIKYQINWGGFLSTKKTLRVTVDGGREMPAMTLYGSRSGKPIIGNFNTDLVALCRIPAQAESTATFELDSELLKQVPKGTELKLMLDKSGGSLYNLPEALKKSNIVP